MKLKKTLQTLPPQLSPVQAQSSFVSASSSFAMGIWLMIPLVIGAMWWPSIGGVVLIVLALSCCFRWMAVRDIHRGFVLGGLQKTAWLRLWFVVNCINCVLGFVVALGVLLINFGDVLDQDRKNQLMKVEYAWIILLVLELFITTRVIAAVATWLESTWVQVIQAIVACVILFSFALHMTVWWIPQQPDEIGWGILIRSGAILAAAALGVIAIWWIADGVNRMAMALVDEVSE